MGRREYKTTEMNPIEVQQMICRMKKKDIAKHYGISPSQLRRWCIKHSVMSDRITDWELKEDILVKNAKEIAYEHGICVRSVYGKLRGMGISMKKVKAMREKMNKGASYGMVW